MQPHKFILAVGTLRIYCDTYFVNGEMRICRKKATSLVCVCRRTCVKVRAQYEGRWNVLRPCACVIIGPCGNLRHARVAAARLLPGREYGTDPNRKPEPETGVRVRVVYHSCLFMLRAFDYCPCFL